MRTVQRCWIRLGFAFGALTLSLAPGMSAAASAATVSGVVRDTQGVAQMGALVEVLSAGPVSAGTAFTDMGGQYRIANLAAGQYQVRASAALFVPTTRSNLRLTAGMRATVNLTLGMLSDPVAWLPAQRRRADEPGDDWTWTLRSAANRPILRMMGDGSVVLVSSGARDAAHGAPMEARVSTMSGDGGFGGGGVHGVVALDRAGNNGSDAAMRASVATAGMGYGQAPATELDAGYERRGMMGGGSRLVVSYASHPEMMTSAGAGNGNVMGMQTMRMASAEKVQLGDSVDVEAGGTVYAIRTAGAALTAQPFLNVTVHPGEVWAVRYRMATSRDVQDFDGLDSIAAELPVAAMCGVRMCTESGMHQEIALSRRAGGGLLQAAVYHDAIARTSIAGTGAMGAAELAGSGGTSGVVVDTETGSFRALGAGTTANGVSVTLSEPLTGGLWAALEFVSGTALETGNEQGTAGLQPASAEAATVAVKGRVLRTGTKLRAAYRWQPRRLATAVGPYEAFSDQAFLSFALRQAVRWGDRLPEGLEATIDVTNLLAEGYQPYLSADGRTLFLAQTPRTVQGGLSFTF
jgi:hypothetical protein